MRYRPRSQPLELTAALPRLGDAVRRARQRSARTSASIGPGDLDLLAWSRRFLPDHFVKEPSRMHCWLNAQAAVLQRERGRKLNVIGPRGGAKSTLGSLAFVLRAALEQREPYIWIVSDTKNQALAHLENIRAELLENRLLQAAYPNACGPGPTWRSAAIVLRNGVTIEAFGTGQRIRGRRRRANRPTLIVGDDLQNDAHMQSALQRERSAAWFFGTLLPAGTKRTNVIHLATALHREALALRLHATAGWTSRIFRAIERWPDNQSLWQTWEALYRDPEDPAARDTARAFFENHRAELEAGAELLWPAEEDLYTLMCLRAESGRTAFEREKQSSPLDPDLCEWPDAYFNEAIWFDAWPNNVMLRVLTLDPSKGSDARRGDYSALVLLAVTGEGMLYVSADLARRPTPQMVAQGAELCRLFQPDAFGIEGNQFQELLAGEFATEFQRLGLLNLQPWTIDNRVNKLVRIRRLGPLLASSRLRFQRGSPGTQLLVNQLRDFPAGDHDDGPDALEMAVRLAGEFLSGTPQDGLGDSLLRPEPRGR
ncbi:MAG TPA: hypothetical protein VFE24_15120 [Pirellulales bacterium]|jgi:predicted phage terminase large subunit-like protein|nr:hypothetical protein [Pirellulales bacterium]